MKKILLTILSVPLVAAQDITGMNMMMGSYSPFSTFLKYALLTGLTILIWLWVFKLWKEINKRR